MGKFKGPPKDQNQQPNNPTWQQTKYPPHHKTEVKDGVVITEMEDNGSNYQNKRKKQMFPGRKVVDPKLLQKYSKGTGMEVKKFGKEKSFIRHKAKMREKKIREAEEDSAKAEILLTESSGLLEVEEGFYTSHITQKQIKEAVDITSAAKGFDLKLQFGPYKMKYTQNGRHLVLGGRKGHLASFDWVTKKLHCEINVTESIHDVCWLHTEHMMAAAQKQWVYIYDNQGIEIHCLKRMDRVLKLEFLPYHFLLCSANEMGTLSWLDVTLGKEVLQVRTYKGRLEVMCQNPYNAVLCCGHPNGTVTMWTPNTKEPVASMLCHPRPIRAMAIDPTGRYMATTAIDRTLKVFDVRNLGEPIQSYHIGSGASDMAFSQKNLLAVAMGNVVEVFRDVAGGGARKPYMTHRSDGAVTGMQFCPYEDILGISTYRGYSSLLIPGAGEPNFDALEANPYVTGSGRKEAEVKALLSKVPSDLITLDPLTISQVDTPRLQEKIEAKKTLLHVRTPKVDFTPRYRMKGKSGSAQKFKRRQQVKSDKQREYLKSALAQQKELGLDQSAAGQSEVKDEKPTEILDRFKPKKKKYLKPNAKM